MAYDLIINKPRSRKYCLFGFPGVGQAVRSIVSSCSTLIKLIKSERESEKFYSSITFKMEVNLN